jgi:hypothetical protein
VPLNQPSRTAPRAQIPGRGAGLFAEHGYQNTTIRDVAARASIDPAMVIRYFQSKDELFARAAAIDLRLPALKASDAGAIGDTLIPPFPRSVGRVRQRHGDLAAFGDIQRIRRRKKCAKCLRNQVGPVIASVGMQGLGGAARRTCQQSALGIGAMRYVLKLPPVVALSREDIVAHVGPCLQRYAMDET